MKASLSQYKFAFLIFFSALLIRISVVFGYAFGFFNGGLKGGDSHLYLEIAHNLLNGNGFATDAGPTAFVSPLFPVFLAVCLSVFGENIILISIVQSILSALVCVCIYRSTRLIFDNSGVAVISGIIAALHYELILWSNAQLLTEPLYVFFFAMAMMLLVTALTRHKGKSLYFFLSGITFGLASLTRPTAIAITAGLAVIMALSGVLGQKRSWRYTISFLGAFVLIMMPWGIRNYIVFDSFTISSLEGGHVLWLGNNSQYDRYEHPDFEHFGGYTVMFKPDKEIAEQLKNKSSVEQNEIFARSAFRHIKSDPFAFLKRSIHKNWNMWRPNFSVSSWRNDVVSYTLYPLILFTAFAGIIFAIREMQIESLANKLIHPVFIFMAIFLMHIAIHSIINGEIRFRVPLWVLLIPFSAFTFSLLLKRVFRGLRVAVN